MCLHEGIRGVRAKAVPPRSGGRFLQLSIVRASAEIKHFSCRGHLRPCYSDSGSFENTVASGVVVPEAQKGRVQSLGGTALALYFLHIHRETPVGMASRLGVFIRMIRLKLDHNSDHMKANLKLDTFGNRELAKLSGIKRP